MDGLGKIRDVRFEFPMIGFGEAGQLPLLMQIAQELACLHGGAGSGILRFKIRSQRGTTVLRTSPKSKHGRKDQHPGRFHNLISTPNSLLNRRLTVTLISEWSSS